MAGRYRIVFFCVCVTLVFAFQSACKKDNDISINEELVFSAEQEELFEALEQTLIPLEKEPLDLADEDLRFLDQLADVQIVGLGEATHGTREFFESKDRIFRYLVENHDFDAILFEADFAESLLINAFVQNGDGSLQTLMDEKMHFWTWKAEEVKGLLQWMTDVNLSNGDAQNLQYFGVDCQYLDLQPELIRPFLELVSIPQLQRFNRIYQPILKAFDDNYSEWNTEDYQHAKDSITIFINWIDDEHEQLLSQVPAREIELQRQLFVNVLQSLHVSYAYSINDQTENHRDKYMAENAIWFLEYLGTGSQVCTWAHNYHAGNRSNFGVGGSMGKRLRDELGAQYQVIGFGFSGGHFTAIEDLGGAFGGLKSHFIDEEPRWDAHNFLFHHITTENFAVDLSALKADAAWNKYFSSSHPFLNIGSVYDGKLSAYYSFTDLDREFDWIFYFRKTKASRVF